MLKPRELETERGNDIWATMCAAESGDTGTLQLLLDRDPSLARGQYWYTQPIHFAVRSGHLHAVALLLAAGADPEWNSFHDCSLIEMASERGYDDIARMLENRRDAMGRVPPGVDLPIHEAAQKNDVERLRTLLDSDPSLIDRGDRSGRAPLHRAVIASARKAVELLLDRGANIHACLSLSRGGPAGWWTSAVQPIDLAIWGANNLAPSRGDFKTAELLIGRGAAYDLTVAAAFGDIHRVTSLLDDDPACISEMRANGRRPLTAAVEFSRHPVVRLLLDRGADPTWHESGAERGGALRIAVNGQGDRALVEMLLAHGADPNAEIDSGGSAVSAASPGLRPLLLAHGGTLEPYDSVFAGHEHELIQRARQDPSSIDGSIFTAIVTCGNRDLLLRLLEAGVCVPPVLTGCRGYLLEDVEMFQILLAHGMNPDLPNWQRQTFLHDVCGRGRNADSAESLKRAEILLNAGAALSARDDEYRSTPLAWAARTNMPQMVDFLLARGAPTNLPDDPPWATPLAWAERRGCTEIAAILRRPALST